MLVEGERGTGKDLVAETLHEASEVSHGPFVVVDCTHSEAVAQAFAPGGAIDQASGGTVVLDELGALPAREQGLAHAAIRAGRARFIATSRTSLDDAVSAGRFREDLRSAFDVGRIELPPLRRRDGDVRFLAHHLWSELGGTLETFPYGWLEYLAPYTWPGNVTELQTLLAHELADPVAAVPSPADRRPAVVDPIETILERDLPLVTAREHLVQEFEKRYLERALVKQNGNVLRAAAASGVARRYFQILRAKRFR